MPIRRRVYKIYILEKSQQQYLSGNCSLSIQSVTRQIVFMKNVCNIMEFFKQQKQFVNS